MNTRSPAAILGRRHRDGFDGGWEVELVLGTVDLARCGVLGGGVGPEPDTRALARIADLHRPPAPRAPSVATVRRLAPRSADEETDAGRPAGGAATDAKVEHLRDAVLRKPLKMAEAGQRGEGMRSAGGGRGT
jgi:hypothetical protein